MAQYILLAVVAGFLIPLQVLINARLGQQLTGPLSGAFVNFFVGLAALGILLVIVKLPIPTLSQINSTPWWAWIGGVLGAFFIFSTTVTVSKLGGAGLFAIIIAAQLIASLLYDHFGVLHTAQPLTLERVIGAVFLMTGVILILRPQL